MTLQPYLRSSALFAFGTSGILYLFIRQAGKIDHRLRIGTEVWQHLVLIGMLFGLFMVAILLGQSACRQSHEGWRRTSVVLSVLCVGGTIAYAKSEAYNSTEFLAILGPYSAIGITALIATLAIFRWLTRWLVSGFAAKKE